MCRHYLNAGREPATVLPQAEWQERQPRYQEPRCVPVKVVAFVNEDSTFTNSLANTAGLVGLKLPRCRLRVLLFTQAVADATHDNMNALPP